MPADWGRARNRWEYGHAAGAGLTLTALAALIASILAGGDTDAKHGNEGD
jgi:hypothetical protein